MQFFEAKIRPLLATHCYKCHSTEAASAGKLKGELLLDTRDGVLKGGKNGAVIVPGKPDKSRLIEAIHYSNEDLQMPPKDRLPAAAWPTWRSGWPWSARTHALVVLLR